MDSTTTLKWRVIGDLMSTGIPERVEWRDGVGLSGTPAAMVAVDELIASDVSIGVTPTGPFIAVDVTDERSALTLCRHIFRGGFDISGDLPDLGLPCLPDGAIP